MTVHLKPRFRWTFTNCQKIGRIGPTQEEADEEYKGRNVNVRIIGQGIQEWRVPETGIYRLDALGAIGATTSKSYTSGKGAYISTLINLKNNNKCIYVLFPYC